MEIDTEKRTELIITKSQPIKTISCQDLFLLSNTFDQIHSWVEMLYLINSFFTNSKAPLNKKKILIECSKLLSLCYIL